MKSTKRGAMVGTFDAKTNFSKLLDRVKRGEVITITNHGEPVAQLGPVRETGPTPGARFLASVRRVQESLLERGESFTQEEVEQWIEEGRP
jgi:prevent-host-death family protein